MLMRSDAYERLLFLAHFFSLLEWGEGIQLTMAQPYLRVRRSPQVRGRLADRPQTVNCQDKSRRPARARVSMQLIHGPSSSFELTFLE